MIREAASGYMLPADLWRGLCMGYATHDEFALVRANPSAALRASMENYRQVGIHWSDDYNSALNFALDRDSEGWAHEAGPEDPDDGVLYGFVLSAQVGDEHRIDPNSQEGQDYAMSDAILDYGIEAEVTVRGDAPVHLIGADLVWIDLEGGDGEVSIPLDLHVTAGWEQNGDLLQWNPDGSGQRWWHGSPVELPVGTWLRPGPKWDQVSISDDPGIARHWGEFRAEEVNGAPRPVYLYEVRPDGPVTPWRGEGGFRCPSAVVVGAEKVAGSSWRGFVDEPVWADHGAIIISNKGPSPSYECYEGPVLVATAHSLADAKARVERLHGGATIEWHQKRLDPIEVNHYWFGPTTEFTESRVVWVADNLPPRTSSLAEESWF